MDSELAALAASGATTLVSLMVTDSWAHARELVRRFLARTGSNATAITDLDNARTRLLSTDATGDEPTTTDVRTQWHGYLQQLVESGSVTNGELRILLTSLQQLAATSVTCHGAVRNEINGGVQHGPVIQSGRITGLTFHTHQSSASNQG
ncbi:hypothetical protein [Streptomyces sp. NBC_01451]|uniref:hypothetical protein n=1 Tax=Streptomyces sp. NBC_01451 TaxID=2903872 RepID=UPI002E33C714|nr:hypothetical protein [Streptomyces sp. NBC_01451]